MSVVGTPHASLWISLSLSLSRARVCSHRRTSSLSPRQRQPGAVAAAQQGVLPALFGFQLGPGQGYVEALTPEQQHQVRV